MAVLVAVVHVRTAVVVEIPVGALNSIVEALALDLVQFLRRRVPATAILTISVRRPLRGAGSLGGGQSCGSE
jgi:hypothetical protein